MGTKHDMECKGGEECLDEEHLCKIIKRRDLARVMALVKAPQYVCSKCGRAARQEGNLCKPVALE